MTKVSERQEIKNLRRLVNKPFYPSGTTFFEAPSTLVSSAAVSQNFPVHTLSDSLRIYYFPLWRADSKISGFNGCVRTEAVSGKKKLRIQKYPDKCGRGLIAMTTLLCIEFVRTRSIVVSSDVWRSQGQRSDIYSC